jgi:hypothetical protein
LSEARLELSGTIADFRALQSNGSPHAADFGLRLGRAQTRLATVERIGPPIPAPRRPLHDPVDHFVSRFGRWLESPPAMLEPVLLLLDGTSKAGALKSILDTCHAANVHVAQFDLTRMAKGRREEFYGCLDYLRGTTPLAASDVVLVVDGATPIAQPLAREFCQLYELGRWKSQSSVAQGATDMSGVNSNWLRSFYLAESASYLQAPELGPRAETKIGFVRRANSALSAFDAADHQANGGYVLFGGPQQDRRRWLGAAHGMMGNMACVDFKLNPVIKASLSGYAVAYMDADGLSKSLASG